MKRRLSAAWLVLALATTACASSTKHSATPAPFDLRLIVGDGMVGSVALGQPTGQVIRSLTTQLGAPTEVQSFLCGNQVPALVAEWGDLSAVFGSGSDSVHAFDKFVYNDGGWNAHVDADGGVPPLVPGHVMWPPVETAGGATVGDTVRQVEHLDPAARLEATIGVKGGYEPSYLIDRGLVLFSSPSGTAAPLQPTDRISVIFDQNGNC